MTSLRKDAASPSAPGHTTSTSEWNSSKLFMAGVPVNSSRFDARQSRSNEAVLAFDPPLSRWPSSMMSRSSWGSASISVSQCRAKASYEIDSTAQDLLPSNALHLSRAAFAVSTVPSALPPAFSRQGIQTTFEETRPKNLASSLGHWATREAGHTTQAFRIFCRPWSSFWQDPAAFTSVRSRANVVNVLPRPISSPSIAPSLFSGCRPDKQPYKNLTASRWWGRSFRATGPLSATRG
mmetsp:Transcript_22139/g.57762  ORF Transcript_22139/g.57762 Transcript_22139/m.57762 type:complete len:237 (+) Transcript_22139:574-1284(+)